jgi:hypothetical protein
MDVEQYKSRRQYWSYGVMLGSILLILFFSLDELIGATILRATYFQWGFIISVMLLACIVGVILYWAEQSAIIIVGGFALFVVLSGFIFAARPYWIFGVSYLAGFAVSIGLFCFIPASILAWIGMSVYAVIRGNLREYFYEPLLARSIIIGSLLFASCYTAAMFAKSSGFNVIEHHSSERANRYVVNYIDVSSGLSFQTAEYECNIVSISCKQVINNTGSQ